MSKNNYKSQEGRNDSGAGHNLLGTVCLALIKKWDIFTAQKGALIVKIEDLNVSLKITEDSGLPYVSMKQSSAKIIGTVPTEIITEAIGLSIEDLYLNEWPNNIVKTEVEHLLVPVRNSNALKSATSNKALLKRHLNGLVSKAATFLLQMVRQVSSWQSPGFSIQVLALMKILQPELRQARLRLSSPTWLCQSKSKLSNFTRRLC